MSTADRTQSGVLELHPKGYGFLRDPSRNFKANTTDVYVEELIDVRDAVEGDLLGELLRRRGFVHEGRLGVVE